MNFLKHTRTKQKSQFQKKKYIYCNLPHRSKQANQIRQKDHKNTTIKSHTAKPKNNTERKVFDTTLEGRQGRTRERIEKVSVHQRRSRGGMQSWPRCFVRPRDCQRTGFVVLEGERKRECSRQR